MASTIQEAQELLEVAPPPPSRVFHPFPRLPIELRTIIWKASLPSRVIELYAKPNGYYRNRRIYSWHVEKCNCLRRCYQEPAVARVNHEARNIINSGGSKCFGQWIYWERDIIYIGQRVPTLHNSGFLNYLEKRGLRDKLQYLAVDYDCWVCSGEMNYDCNIGLEVATSPAAMISRFPGIRNLILVERRGCDIWRDETEILAHSNDDDSHRVDDDTEAGRWDYEEQVDETDPGSSAQHNDPSVCRNDNCPMLDEWMRPTIKRRLMRGKDGSCGVALVSFEKLETAFSNSPIFKGEIEKDWKDWRMYDIKTGVGKLKQCGKYHYPGDPDNKKRTPYTIECAFLRNTAPSCMMEDSSGLENDWLPPSETDWMIDFPEEYETRDRSQDFPSDQYYHTLKALYEADGYPQGIPRQISRYLKNVKNL
ncbi:hypothetical protein NHQ30_008319 [Ciborinia camelliae]|nr:hypothetical protein NHQ30_008319 [Ciborinia camelliae]